MASKNTPSLRRFNVERQPTVQSSRPGYHFEGKALPDANAMPDFIEMDVIAIQFNALYLLFLGTEGAYLCSAR